MLTFEQALRTVREKIEASVPRPPVRALPLGAARGRVLAEDLTADRDYPPFHRATRDGYAVRTGDVTGAPIELKVTGLARAGAPYGAQVSPGCAVEIMTGAPLPEGTDAVVMVEHTREATPPLASGALAAAQRVEILRPLIPFENVVRQGSEAKAGEVVLARGRKLGPGEIGLAASLGRTEVRVFARPRVAIITTGDEVIPADQKPDWFQIRNSNSWALAAQVEAARGVSRVSEIARDDKDHLRRTIEEALECDLLVMSGGISVGKYDFVGEVLASLGAGIYFQGVALRPGKPLTFGRVRGRFFFALPGNPVSTFVTFELFVRPAIALLGGAEFEPPVFLKARLGKPVHHKTGLTMFMPARVEPACAKQHLGAHDLGAPASESSDVASDPVVELVGWQGSGDLAGLARANCFLVMFPGATALAAGDWVDVLPKSW